MEHELAELLSELGYWYIDGINQYHSTLCVEINDRVYKFSMGKRRAQDLLDGIREANE